MNLDLTSLNDSTILYDSLLNVLKLQVPKLDYLWCLLAHPPSLQCCAQQEWMLGRAVPSRGGLVRLTHESHPETLSSI